MLGLDTNEVNLCHIGWCAEEVGACKGIVCMGDGTCQEAFIYFGIVNLVNCAKV